MSHKFKYFLLGALAVILLRGGIYGILVTVRILLMLMLAAYFARLIKKYLPPIFSDIYIGRRPVEKERYNVKACPSCGWLICKCAEIKKTKG